METLSCPNGHRSITYSKYRLGNFNLKFCSECKLYFAPDAYTVEVDYSEIYNTEEYRDVQVNDINNQKDLKAFINHPTYHSFFKNISKDSGKKLLDIGCGVGRFCHAAESQGWNVEGIDISEKAVEIAKSYARFPVRVATIEQEANSEKKYDVATAFEVLEHLEKLQQFLHSTSRVLKPGGQLFCTVPNWDCIAMQTATRRDWIPPVHLNFFTVSSLESTLKIAGFTNVKTGLIYSNSFPDDGIQKIKWLLKAGFLRKNLPLGIWVHATTK